ncbi:MAG: DEAD/DEAH box helicase family protein, partial [Gammaproteobacteria bacterium]
MQAVRGLVRDAREQGPGHRYLVQHSAGSGKSYTIGWLAHRLATLHNAHDDKVFDSIIVITDRRVLDRQLQRTLLQLEQTPGVVENIDTASTQLKDALESGKTIIVTTLQKFPVIVEQIGQLAGKRFAAIIDEAHSSQSGEGSRSLRMVLSADGLEEAEIDDAGEITPEDELDEMVEAAMAKRGLLSNLSLFAFTAMPKQKTLELFGRKNPAGEFEPFHLYSMRQAIEEGFILDVLASYTTYETYWRLLKKIEDDPQFDKKKAAALMKAFVELHPHAIHEKLAVMVEHFATQIQNRIKGQAKVMIVTRSRLHAVRYKLAIDKYLAEKGYPFKALVAFSGSVHDSGRTYTEAGMNGFPETQTAATFNTPQHRFLIVASKFQTGFDQPLLHTMYVDKKLGGVNAVQTLSRLNRIHLDKDDT